MSWGQKPENALNRALALKGINQPDVALSTLHEVLSSRRNRTWSPIYEEIMKAYIDLCLELNKFREAKDGLHQYRNLSQSQAPGSLENVIRYLLDQSAERCKEAKAISETEANDASAETSPEVDATSEVDAANMLLMATMTADPGQSQKESLMLLPRIKFLWEAYRAVLDILKSNSKLERLYHVTAVGALQFCSEYKKRTEFRRLCDLLRIHLQNLHKYGGAAAMAKVEDGAKPNNKIRGWEGWTTESIELHLQTRFTQLETASTLHLYTEGFRTVEDIHTILQISHSRRKVVGGTGTPKAKIMAAYYEKLNTLFWVSKNYLFHAFAWYKFYTLCKEYNKGMTEEQKKLQASAVLLSALCIPSIPGAGSTTQSNDGSSKIKSTTQDEIKKANSARMATLLGFHTRNPTREALLSEIRAKNVMADVPDYLRDLYKLLEENSNPLVLVERAKPLLERLRSEVGTAAADGSSIEEKSSADVSIEGTLSAYVEPIISVLLLKLMHALSASYHNISLDHIKSLTSGLGVDFTQVEKTIITAATSKESSLRVRIDHRANCLRFGDAGGCAQLESDNMKSQLTILSKQLDRVCNVISPPDESAKTKSRMEVYAEVRASVNKEHEDMLERKDLIEKRKEEAERLIQEKIKEDQQKKLEAMENARAEEERRLAREQLLREKEKQDKIKKELEITEKKNYLKALGQNVDAMTEAEFEAVDVDKLAKEHATKAAKKKDNAERKVKEMQKKLDYIVRATRIEEVPLIKKRYEESVEAEKKQYEDDVIEKARKAKIAWKTDCELKSELKAHDVFSAMAAFEDVVMAGRVSAHEAACIEEDTIAEDLAEKAKLKRARKRKEEEIRLRKEEEERILKEEEARKAEEERQRREEERRRKEAEQEELRKKRDAERFERERQKQKEAGGSAAPSSSALDNATGRYVPPSRRGTGGGGGGNPRSAWGQNSRGSNYGGGRYEGGGRDQYGSGGGRRDDRGGYGGSAGGDRGGYDRRRDDREPSRGNSRWN